MEIGRVKFGPHFALYKSFTGCRSVNVVRWLNSANLLFHFFFSFIHPWGMQIPRRSLFFKLETCYNLFMKTFLALILVSFLGHLKAECKQDSFSEEALRAKVLSKMQNEFVSFRRYSVNSIVEKEKPDYEATLHFLARKCMTMSFQASKNEQCQLSIVVTGLVPCVRP